MKHKVGDTVRVKSKAWIDAQPKDSTGDIYVVGNDGEELYIVDEMFKYAGQSFKVTSIYADSNYELGDMSDWEWSDAMLEDDSDIEALQKRVADLEAEVLQLKGEKKPEEIVYDKDKHYVAIWQNKPFILKMGVNSEEVWTFCGIDYIHSHLTDSASSGQEAIDIAIEETSQFDNIPPVSIYGFDTGKEALEFMLKYL